MPDSAEIVRARRTLADILADWELRWLLWPGPGGKSVVRELSGPNWGGLSLEGPSQDWAQRILSFWQCHNLSPSEPLVLVVEMPQALPYLRALHLLRSRIPWLIVILLDPESWLAAVPTSGGWFQRSDDPPAHSWPCWLRDWDLDFWGSISLEEARTISERLDPLLTGGGRRLLHLYGHGQPANASPAAQEAMLISPTDSLEAAFLQDLPSLLSDSIQLIWSLPQTPPGSLQGLLCQPEHLAAAAFGVAQAGLFPVLALSAGQIGQALPGLLEGLPPGCLLLLLEAGLVWEAGQSHLAPSRLRDLALLRQIHGLALTCPSDLEEALQIVQLSYHTETPIALRLSQAPAVNASMASTPMAAGCAHCLRQGKNVAIFALGPIVYAALLAAESLASWGVECQVWDVRFVKPLDREALTQASQCGFILTVEEHCLQGGLATTVLETLSQLKEYPRVEHLALPASPPIQRGTNLEEMALDADGIQRAVRQLLGLASHLMGAS